MTQINFICLLQRMQRFTFDAFKQSFEQLFSFIYLLFTLYICFKLTSDSENKKIIVFTAMTNV